MRWALVLTMLLLASGARSQVLLLGVGVAADKAVPAPRCWPGGIARPD